MHLVSNSAESTRDQRRRATTRALTDAARALTTRHGFAGFTVEELCAEVGVSRRTFFNYFESKENAVFGFAVVDPRQEAVEEEFVAATGDLVDDFVDMMIHRFALFNPIDDAAAMFAVIEQEPRLLKAAFQQLGANERRDAALVLRRIGDGEGNALRAEVVVQTVGSLLRLSMDQLLHHHSTEAFGDLLTRRVAIARSAFTSTEKAD